MVGRLLRLTGAASVIAAIACVTPVLDSSAPASADTVVDGCTIVSNPTPTNFTNCPGANLSGANLSGVNLSYANLAGADLAFGLNAANLAGANLSNANLTSAALLNVNLSNANLTSADLMNSTLITCVNVSGFGEVCPSPTFTGATLTDANLSGETFAQSTSQGGGAVNLSGVVLSGANFTGATLGVCFSGVMPPACDASNLTGANLTGANLTNTDMTAANLTGATLTGATLTGATLTRTILVPSGQTVAATSSAGAVATWTIPPSLPGATPGSCTPPASGSTFPLGTTTVTCQVLDDQSHVALGSFTVTVVTPVHTATSLSTSPNPSLATGYQVTYTATVSPIPSPTATEGTGTVSFTDNGSPVLGCMGPGVPVSGGVATCLTSGSGSPSAGAHSIVATYNGSAGFLPSTSPSVTQNVACQTLPGCNLSGLDLSNGPASSCPPSSCTLFDTDLAGANLTGTNLSGAQLGDANLTGTDLTDANVTGANFNGATLTGATFTGTLLVPPNKTVPATSNAGAVVTWPTPPSLPGATPGACAPSSGSTFSLGTHTVTCQIHDNANNLATGAFQVTVQPFTHLLLPSNGAVLAGTSVLDAWASDSPGISSVTFEVSGGALSNQVVATASPTIYGWLAQWNTTSVSNGTYSLQSVATDAAHSTETSSPITITVSNPVPTTSVLIPSGGATVSGMSQVLDAVASSGATQVQYEVTGGALSNQVVATASPTIYGWLAKWNTTSVPNGTYTLRSVASYSGGVSASSTLVTISVNNPPPSTAVLIPSSGATQDTAHQIIFDATASPGVTQVTFDIGGDCGGIVLTATPTIYGWIAVAGGSSGATPVDLSCWVQSVASYSGGVTGSSSLVPITVIAYRPTPP
jgi:uncharacterized protein YjbI with pentapeptide repeats